MNAVVGFVTRSAHWVGSSPYPWCIDHLLDDWIADDHPDLVEALNSLTAEDFVSMGPEWPHFIDRVFQRVAASNGGELLAFARRASLHSRTDLGWLIMKRAPAGSVDREADRGWITDCVWKYADCAVFFYERPDHEEPVRILKHFCGSEYSSFLAEIFCGLQWEIARNAEADKPSWELFGAIIRRIAEPNKSRLISLARPLASRVPRELRRLLIDYAGAGSYDSDLDRDWVEQYVEGSGWTSQDGIDHGSAGEMASLVRFLGSAASRFPAVAARVEFVKEERRLRAAALARQQEAERKASEAREKALSQLSTLERLETIFEDEDFPLEKSPDDWTVISAEASHGFDSVRLTRLIRSLRKRVRQKRGRWKDLRSALYRLRQSVYNAEKGYH